MAVFFLLLPLDYTSLIFSNLQPAKYCSERTRTCIPSAVVSLLSAFGGFRGRLGDNHRVSETEPLRRDWRLDAPGFALEAPEHVLAKGTLANSHSFDRGSQRSLSRRNLLS